MEYGHAEPYPQYTEGPTGQPQAVCAWQRRTSWRMMTFKRFAGGATPFHPLRLSSELGRKCGDSFKITGHRSPGMTRVTLVERSTCHLQNRISVVGVSLQHLDGLDRRKNE
jgi:hypothetical protein